MKLFAPESYWNDPRVEEVVGGCGPGGFGDWLIPDTLWGLSVKESCRIHDWCYFIGKTEEDKREADGVFLNNMLRQIQACESPAWLKCLRRHRAKTYYCFVRDFGGPSFWDDKNTDLEFREYGMAT